MPPWPSRLPVASSGADQTPSSTKGKGQKKPPHISQRLDNDLQHPPLLGVPFLASNDPFAPSPPKQKPRHGRSHSNPFASLFGHGKKSEKIADAEIQYDGLDRQTTSSSGLSSTVQMAGTNGVTAHSGEKELVAGKCSTCDSTMKWPRQVDSYRCQVCLMINDLRPSSISTNGVTATDTASNGAWKRYPNISMERTRALIDECLKVYLDNWLDSRRHHFPEHSTPKIENGIGSLSLSSSPPKFDLTTKIDSPSKWTIPPPTRPPPPPHPFQASPPPTAHSGITSDPQSPQDPSRSIFRRLENYVIACFTDVECLNASFATERGSQLRRVASESTAAPRQSTDTGSRLPPKDGNCISPNSMFPELDAKTLLLGDFAENGMWWTGKGQFDQQRMESNGSRVLERSLEDRVSSKNPRIQWSEVNAWYHMIISMGRTWRKQLQELQVETHKAGSAAKSNQIPEEAFNCIENEVTEACAHVQRTLLKATEKILTRPGRPLRRPDDTRFLLILLANPLLYPSESGSPMQPKQTKSSDPSNSVTTPAQPPTSNRSPRTSVPHRRSPSNKSGTIGRHTGIIKRILGLLANLPSECHHYLVNWFSRFSEPHFRRLVDLIGSFVTYRLSRQHGRKRSDSPDPHGGLVPSISGPGAGTSAQLHAALGVSGTAKSSEKKDKQTPYCEDWQIKAAARIMSLLFSANIQNAYRPPDGGRKESGSAARNGAHPHSQLLPTSAFYNTMLDHADLVADFDTWESRKGKFSFCQYPMFLSIWAKIRIIEHDVRRQMEIKAREAFFNSILNRKAISQYLVLKVRRECLVEDSLRNVSEIVGSGQDEIKKGLRIDFIGEEGLDSGGLRKEWFLLLVRDVFDPEHGLFIYDEESQYCYFNPNSFETSDQFFLVGVVLGLAIYNSTILDVALPPFAFRKLLASAPNYTGPSTSFLRSTHTQTLEDLAEFRPSLARGLRQLLDFEGNVQEVFCRDFVAPVERYGFVDQVPLCSNGENRPVTNSNRHEFVDLYVKYILDTSVSRQYEPFKRGFFGVCEGNALSLFRPEEIEVLVRGSEEPLDINTLRAVAIYDGWAKGKDPADESVVNWFWESFSNANAQDQRKMLRFITSSDRIPAMGAMCLTIKITCLGDDSDRFPIARTCFNMLGIYRYKTKVKLEHKLWKAVNESEGFGIK
ncbi:putative E3 ubiquitin-protein ligase [Lecanora helva]